jgi:FixJ family two-component response regulator
MALAPRGLTGRESEVLALIAHGASNASISQILGTTPRTGLSRWHRGHCLRATPPRMRPTVAPGRSP